MKNSRPGLFVCLSQLFVVSVLFFSFLAVPAWAQKGESYHDLLTAQVQSGTLAPPEHLKSYVVDGKLRLSLRDAVVLTLENNSLVRIQETQVEFSKFSLLGAHSPFDPVVTGSYNINSSTFPPSSTLEGVGTGTFNNTTQIGQFNYSQTFDTGTNIQAGFSSNNSVSNNSFQFLNPAITSTLNFQVTQP